LSNANLYSESISQRPYDIDLLIQIRAGIDALDKAKHEIDPIGRSEKIARFASAYDGDAD
jgi:hypothetical protein